MAFRRSKTADAAKSKSKKHNLLFDWNRYLLPTMRFTPAVQLVFYSLWWRAHPKTLMAKYSLRDIQKTTLLSQNTVIRAVRELQKAKVIRVVFRSPKKGVSSVVEIYPDLLAVANHWLKEREPSAALSE